MIQINKSVADGSDLVIENHALFDYVYNSIKKNNEVQKVMKVKKSIIYRVTLIQIFIPVKIFCALKTSKENFSVPNYFRLYY